MQYHFSYSDIVKSRWVETQETQIKVGDIEFHYNCNYFKGISIEFDITRIYTVLRPTQFSYYNDIINVT